MQQCPPPKAYPRIPTPLAPPLAYRHRDRTHRPVNTFTIHIQVRDRGPGIPAAELEKIFQAFVQSSQTRDGSGGTGLGLAICRKIMTAHGGRIHATNAPGEGAIFHITVPTAGYTDTMPAPLL